MDDSATLRVSYCENFDDTCRDLSNPLIIIDIISGGCKIHWIISDMNTRDILIWRDIEESVDATGTISKVFGGGENSFWRCQCTEDYFRFRYEISGSGGGSIFMVDIPK